MTSNKGAHPRGASEAGLVVLLAVAGAAGLRWGQAHGALVPLRSAVGLLALTAAVGLMVWRYRARVRAARRLFAALDAYAEQERVRAERRLPTPALESNRG